MSPNCSYRLVCIAIASIAISCGGAGCGGAAQKSATERRGEHLRFELARTYVASGAAESAIPLLKRELAERPNWVEARILYGVVLRDLGLYSQANSQLRYALKLKPESAAAHADLGILCDLQGEPGCALEHHRRAVQLAPSVAKYHNNLGFSLYLNKKNGEAIRELEIALEQDPGLSVAYNNIGFAYGRRGEFKKAERSFSAVRSRAATLFNMSLVYDEQGSHERARELRENAYLLDESMRPSTHGGPAGH